MPRGLFTLKQQLQGVIQKAWNTTINPLKTPAVDYLVVAGGGSTGAYGGGGAGGLLQGSVPVAIGSAITVTVGGGGAPNTNGANSVFGSIVAVGGGGPTAGGSGAGNFNGGFGFQGTFGQGNKGGDSTYYPTYYLGSGGAGAGTPSAKSITTPTQGGSGIASVISGTVTAYAGGGSGGQAYNGDYIISGGVGGGGSNGNSTNSYIAQSGTANTGGGAGGTSFAPGSGAGTPTGGSGIVIVSYPDIYAAAASTTGSPTVSTSGSGSLAYTNTVGTRVVYSSSSSAAWSFGTGDFTVEGYIYLATGSTSAPLVFDARASSAGVPWAISAGTSTNTTFFYIGAQYNSSVNLSANTWTHLAVTRSSGNLYIFVGGVQGFSGSVTANLDTAGSLFIGENVAIGQNWSGFLSNLRIVKGTALYTSAFTPPTSPLTAVSGTTLLLQTVSGSPYVDSSVTSAVPTSTLSVAPAWNQSSPFATGLGYKNRVYTYTGSGTITF